MKTPFEKCPKCGNEDIEYGDDNYYSDANYLRVFCQECDYEWWEIYKFIHCEDVDGNVIDNHKFEEKE